eukprot:3938201-Rhodomonas_salina.1
MCGVQSAVGHVGAACRYRPPMALRTCYEMSGTALVLSMWGTEPGCGYAFAMGCGVLSSGMEVPTRGTGLGYGGTDSLWDV